MIRYPLKLYSIQYDVYQEKFLHHIEGNVSWEKLAAISRINFLYFDV